MQRGIGSEGRPGATTKRLGPRRVLDPQSHLHHSSIVADYTRRLQILLTEGQHEFLTQLAERRGQSVADLVRSAVQAAYAPQASLTELRIIEQLRADAFLDSAALERALAQLTADER